ncbi:MAG: thioredoxin domain-containing protein [Caulobacteraceae bacterium]
MKAGGAAVALLVGLFAVAGARAAEGDMSLGDPKAPVTVVEYASVGCSHCAAWANTVFPAFRQKFIDTGKVRFVFREMLTGDPALAAAGFLTARCAGPAKYFQVVEAVFADQDEIVGRDAAPVLARIAKDAGLPEERFLACIRDETALKALQTRTAAVAGANHITGTPTFVVGREKLQGEQSLTALDAAIARAARRR